MTQLREIYKCNICGNVVEIVNEGAPSLVCCGQPMEKLLARTEDQGKEKHVPVIEEISGGIKVKVGSVAHPMEDKHYIKFVEVLTADAVFRSELKAGMAPEASFPVKMAQVAGVREFCTVHGLWKNQ